MSNNSIETPINDKFVTEQEAVSLLEDIREFADRVEAAIKAGKMDRSVLLMIQSGFYDVVADAEVHLERMESSQ